MELIDSPHDTFAKYIFRDTGRAADELAVAVGETVAALIDWSTLRLEPTELVDEVLNWRLPDLRFTARLAEQEIRLDLIFEHQSESDPLMPVRFFCHTGAIWNTARKEGRSKVPLVVNVVLHNGARAWRAPTELWASIEGGEVFHTHAPGLLPTLPILIDDLAGVSDEQILRRKQAPEVRLALLMLKHVRTADAVNVLAREGELIRQVGAADREVLRQTMRYVLTADEQATRDRMVGVLADQFGGEAEEIVMTGVQLIEQGRQEGRQQGRQEGRKEGEVTGQAKGLAGAILRVLIRRELDVPQDVRTHIETCTDTERLSRWLDLAVTAPSARDVISD